MKRFIVVDLETTGNNPKKGDRIIQVGLVVVENGEIIDRFSSFVFPEMEIPMFIQQFTGITDDMVAQAPTFSTVAPTLMEYLNDSYFVAHNVHFDLSFLQHEFEECGYASFQGPAIDTVELARLLLPSEESYKLNHLATKLNYSHDRPHQADSDAEVTARLLIFLLNKLKNLPLLTLQQLKPIVKRLNGAIEDIVSIYIQQKLTSVIEPSPHYDEYRQLVLKKPKIKNSPTFFEKADINDQLPEIENRFSSLINNFQFRQGQVEMMTLIDQAFKEQSHLLVEAGTGTGKSIAYLIPSIYFAKNNDISMVVSTHTVQLQEQLVERDMVMLEQTLPFEFRWAVLKGRSHYICLRKFEQKLKEPDQNYDVVLTKGQLLIWLTETESADREQLNLPSGGNVFWAEVQSEATSCLGRHCPWFNRCFYHKARNDAYGADLIITNHALLLTDILQEQSILPSYKYVIIDEAHHLEEVASDHFGVKTDYFQFIHLFARLGTLETRDLLSQAFLIQEEKALNIEEFFHKVDSLIPGIKYELDDCFRQLHSLVAKNFSFSKGEIGRKSLRYFPNQMTRSGWTEIQEAMKRVQLYMKDFLKIFKRILDEISLEEETLSYSQQGIVTTLRGLYGNFSEEIIKLEELLLQYDPNHVYWMEADPRGAKNATYLYTKPIEVADILTEHFFNKKKSVIMTSATLTVKNSFQYITSRLGIVDSNTKQEIIPSPFAYEEQVKVMVPKTFPNIKEVPEDEYIYEVVISILDIAKITKGRMLVLFTSYDMLRKVYYQLKDFIMNDEFVLMGQGISSGSRAKLTKNFKQFEHAILLGTSSFWEGVDIPGEDLSCLVIVRLPFTPPDNPIFEARSEKVKLAGKSPFMELSLPQAIIRFKQGFGRLIRSEKDRGVVFVFDRRMTDTRYGKQFIQSLPKVPISENSLQHLLYDLEKWL